MYLPVLFFLIFVILDDATANRCPSKAKMKIIQKYLVKVDRSKYIIDHTLADVRVKINRKGLFRCSYTLYSKQGDGSIQEMSHHQDMSGKLISDGTEQMKKTTKHGVFAVSGTYETTHIVYTGYLYVLYADDYIFAYYECEVNARSWNMAIQVRAEYKTKLLAEAGENEVKKSMKKAEDKMRLMLRELNMNIDKDFTTYKLEDLCP